MPKKKHKKYKEVGAPVEIEVPSKVCTRCHKDQPMSCYKWLNEERGFTKNCDTCCVDNAMRQAKWRSENPQEAARRARESNLKWRAENPELYNKRALMYYHNKVKKDPNYSAKSARYTRTWYAKLKAGDPVKFAAWKKKQDRKTEALVPEEEEGKEMINNTLTRVMLVPEYHPFIADDPDFDKDKQLAFNVAALTEKGKVFSGRVKISRGALESTDLLEYLQKHIDIWRDILEQQEAK